MNNVQTIENTINQLPTPVTETEHFFTEGLYTRQLRMPKGTLATGKRHKAKTLNILISGTMQVSMDDNPDKMVTLKAPVAFESAAGVKKAVFCVTECVILNVHRSNETDLEKLEAEIIEPADLEAVL